MGIFQKVSYHGEAIWIKQAVRRCVIAGCERVPPSLLGCTDSKQITDTIFFFRHTWESEVQNWYSDASGFEKNWAELKLWASKSLRLVLFDVMSSYGLWKDKIMYKIVGDIYWYTGTPCAFSLWLFLCWPKAFDWFDYTWLSVPVNKEFGKK